MEGTVCPVYGLLEVPEVLWHHRAHGRMAVRMEQ